MSEYNVTRNEKLLSSVASGNPSGIDPITREEMFLSYIAGESDTKPKPITRKEKLLDKIGVSGGGGGAKPEQEKTVDITENGTTDVLPDDGYALSKVTVNVSVSTNQVTPTIGFVPIRWYSGGNYQQEGAVLECDYYGTFVGEAAFKNGTEIMPFGMLQKVNFKGEVIYIYPSAFQNCRQLLMTELPSALELLGASAFYGCSSVTFNFVPQGITVINEATFRNCTSITEFFFHKAITKISSHAFNGCSGIQTLTFEGALTSDLTTTSFASVANLQNVTIGEGWAVNIYLHYSNNLTVESLHGMIENLADLTGQTAKTFQVGATNLAKIDEDHMAMLESKNWNFS